MLLILSAISVEKRVLSTGPSRINLLDLPRIAREQLNLFGLMLPTTLLAGADQRRLESLRDHADKAACPCLALVETEPQPLCGEDDAADAATDRILRVLQVAHRLGCNSTAFAVSGSHNEEHFSNAVERLKHLLERADRLEINVLLSPHKGLTDTPERVTTLIKKVGGFRVGSMPDFTAAAASGNPVEYLRRVTPYASAVVASVSGFDAEGRHTGYDLEACVEAVASVGFEGALAIEHRGRGDALESVSSARRVLEKKLGLTEG